jgi:TetR/AcrR family tetracycline transcriptional repressor
MATLRVDSLRITDEALKLLRTEGLDAVSLRRIAAGLGVGASTLYWHIRDKNALLTALAHRIFQDCLDAVGEQDDWRDWLRAFGLALWQAQVDIPDVRTLIVLARPDPEQRSAVADGVVQTLVRLGLDETVAPTAQRSVQALVTGWTTLSAARPISEVNERASFETALMALIRGWNNPPLGPDG